MRTKIKQKKIGILDAFLPGIDEEGIDWDGTPAEAYIRFLDSAGKHFTYQVYKVSEGVFPTAPEKCDGYILTGSTAGVYEAYDWLAPLSQFIRGAFDAGVKLTGICFGHQMLANALGGRAEKSEKGWGVGAREFAITGRALWMKETPETCSLYFVHQDQVVVLPPGAVNLGGNTFCPHTLFTIPGRVLGIQGHPEFTRPIMEDIMETLVLDISPEQYRDVLHSLDAGEVDNLLLAGWIRDFFLN